MSRYRDLTGEKFGRLTVLGLGGRDQRNALLWRCQCECGTAERLVPGNALRTGNTASCGGCERGAPHEQHGMSRSPTWASWKSAIQRCTNPNAAGFAYYGGRGITFHEPWRLSFQAFLDHIGPRPSLDHSLDRFPDPDGDYCPGNVRWATREEQARNTRSNHLVEYRGEVLCVTEAAELAHPGVTAACVSSRLALGWSIDRALATPPDQNRKLSRLAAQEVFDRLEAGAKLRELGKRFGVSLSTVSLIKVGKTWPEIDRAPDRRIRIWNGLPVPAPGLPRIRVRSMHPVAN